MNHFPLIIDAIRTPRGRGNAKGALAQIAPAALLAQHMQALLVRTPIDSALIQDTFIGCVNQTGEQGSNIGKLAAVLAGWSDTVPALTLNRFCTSGLSAVQLGAQQVLAHEGFAVAGGVEMMSRVPLGADQGPLVGDLRLQHRARIVPIGIAADTVATLEGFCREACDDYALRSQQRATAARAQGWLSSIVPVMPEVAEPDVAPLLSVDETPRESTTATSLARMPAAFAAMGAEQGWDAMVCSAYGLAHIDHVHHAGNAPATADGASLVLLGSLQTVARHRLKVRARIVASAITSVDHTLALTGAVDATRMALNRAQLSVADIDLFEVNESFAALMLHYMKHLGISHAQLNVNGGAIALGHAMGSTGSALLGALLDELERRDLRRGVVAVCGATGVAAAMVIERLR